MTFLHIPPQPGPTPAPTPHQPVYFYSLHLPLRHILHILSPFFFKISTALHHQHQRSAAEIFTPSHHLRVQFIAPLLRAPTLVPLWFSSPTLLLSVWIHKNTGSVRLSVRGSGRARGRRQLRAIAAIHIRLPEERVGGSCDVFFFFSSRHAEATAFKRAESVRACAPGCWSPPSRLTDPLPPPLAAQPCRYNQQTVP